MSSFVAILPLFFLLFPETSTELHEVRVGMIGFEKYQPDALAFSRSAGIINYALDKLEANKTLDQIVFKFFWKIVDCDYYSNAFTIGVQIGFILDDKIDLLIAGPCVRFIRVAGALSAAYRVPVLSYGYAFSNSLLDVKRFPFLSTITPSYGSLSSAFLGVIDKFEWYNYSLLSTSNGDFCREMFNSIESLDQSRQTTSLRLFINPNNITNYQEQLRKANARSRVWAFCGENSYEKRLFLLMCDQFGYNTTDYLFIFLDMRSLGYAQFEELGEFKLGTGRSPFWLDYKTNNGDELDDVAARMVRLSIAIDVEMDVDDETDQKKLREYVMEHVREEPLNCNTTECLTNTGKRVALFAPHLYDAFLNYALAMNKTIQPDGYWNTDLLVKNLRNNFDGMSGNVVIDANGIRQSNYQITAVGDDMYDTTWIIVNVMGNNTELIPKYVNESQLWSFRKGARPLNEPKCGYSGWYCPKDAWQQYQAVFIIVICLACLLVVVGIASVIIILKQKRDEQVREDSRWQVPYHSLLKRDKKGNDSRSMRSLMSNPSSTSTKMTTTSLGPKNNFNIFYIGEEPVIAEKVNVNHKTLFQYRAEIVQARKLEHDNVNKFIGLVIDISPQYSLWKNCERGTLREVLVQQHSKIDDFFMCSLIADIAAGLAYIHRSSVEIHGRLTSKTCFVNDRWQVKISDYGLHFISTAEREDRYEQLYFAPEVLRGEPKSKEADIYAFAIVMSEIVTLKLPYNAGEEKGNQEERLYLLKKGGMNPPRPDLILPEGVEMNMAMLHLIRDCWSEDTSHRPPVETVRSLLKGMQHGKQNNLMDYALAQMEEYASKLELEVEDQTRELTEEKKRSDVLLYRMLPKQVAEKLKLGQSVEPESFDQVTIFFSDVVKFTQLAQKCTPLQIINLLNELFTIFDNLIDEHGVYKVETIGDGYLCVSGLPFRNGTQHVRDIAEMSLDFMDGCRKFRIPHLPHERVHLRIGMNTGPCVAGVVGLTMPRYCLFGDVVNTGSRMESNGKPGMIHMTESANTALQRIGGYVTVSRGDVIIKGKGVMETFWLMSREGETSHEMDGPTSRILKRQDTRNFSRQSTQPTLNLKNRVIDDSPIDTTPTSAAGESVVVERNNGMYENFRTAVY